MPKSKQTPAKAKATKSSIKNIEPAKQTLQPRRRRALNAIRGREAPASPPASPPHPAGEPSGSPTPVGQPQRQTKKAQLSSILARSQGATMTELTHLTGWQQHSIRAAITGLRKEGREIARNRDDTGITHYRLIGDL